MAVKNRYHYAKIVILHCILVSASGIPTETSKHLETTSGLVPSSEPSPSPTTLLISSNNTANVSPDNGSAPTNEDSPGIVNNENVTEAEIVITEARHGKSLNHHKEHESLIKNDSVSTSASIISPTSGNFSVRLAQDGDHVVQNLSDGDAPPGGIDEDVQGKPEDLQEPRLLFVSTTAPVPTERDRMIQRIFGGECDFAHWNRCSRLKFWGGDYLVPDKNNPGEFITRHHKIRCVESPGYTVCLKNGWTVARCHMLCMSQCNLDFRMNFEKLVLHEGDCKFPLLLR